MPKYVVYEVWTRRAQVVEAANVLEAYPLKKPEPVEGFVFSNWRVLPAKPEEADGV